MMRLHPMSLLVFALPTGGAVDTRTDAEKIYALSHSAKISKHNCAHGGWGGKHQPIPLGGRTGTAALDYLRSIPPLTVANCARAFPRSPSTSAVTALGLWASRRS